MLKTDSDQEALISLSFDKVGKKFENDWIFKNLSFQIKSGTKQAIIGRNGSGKSTFLQLAAGIIKPSEGIVSIYHNERIIEKESIYKYYTLASPYLDLPEDYTLEENINFFCRFKPLQGGLSISDVCELSNLKDARNKMIRNFSSGMKQRLKLSLAILADCNLLLLDEPLTNLDQSGVDWFKKIIYEFASMKTVIVCSNNILDEISFCDNSLNIMLYK
jgi:ABC-type multidrug transport system ATPase subunit